MKKMVKIFGIGVVIFVIGGLGGLLVDYIIFAKIINHPVWSQNPIIKSIDDRIKVIKTTEKVIIADNESIAVIASRAAGSVVYVETITENGDVIRGNGMIMSSDGVIVTDASIVAEDEAMFTFVKMANGDVHDVKNIYFDNYRNLAFLRVDAHDLSTTSFANSDDARSGKRLISIARSQFDESKFALGGFFGRDYAFSINNPKSDFLQGVLEIDFSQNVLEQSIGSPVVDFQGNAVGLISMKENIESKQKEFYAIAAKDLYSAYEEFLINQQKEDSEIIERTLGIDYDIITKIDVYTNEHDILGGVIVVNPQTYIQQSAFANTEAAKSGIKGGDIIVMVNNEVIDENNNLSRLLRKYKNEMITLQVLRAGDMIIVELNNEVAEVSGQ
ncbi:MAG: trypsin-like peptidase domain-containing protein [Candidatus Moraniibacteriota bacterium]|jgi:S1-C subfamily serine protease